MKIQYGGIEIEVELDGEGFPEVTINTCGGFIAENERPAVAVNVSNGGKVVQVYDMFDDDDTRWKE